MIAEAWDVAGLRGRRWRAARPRAALLLFAAAQPVAGALSDRVGRKPLLVGFGVIGLVGTVPLFLALERVRPPGGEF